MAVLTADDVIHENSGTATTATTSLVVPLAGSDTTTDGNVVFIFISKSAGITVSAPPTGFVLGGSNGPGCLVYWKAAVSGESSWTFTLTAAGSASFDVWEMSNVDTIDPIEVSAGSSAFLANGGTLTSGTTTRTAGLDVGARAFFGVSRDTSGVTQSWSGYTNGFEEVLEITNPGTTLTDWAVAQLFHSGTTRTFETTATVATTDADTTASTSFVIVFRAANTAISAPLQFFTGFEFGTHAGIGNLTLMNSGSLTNIGTWGTGYLVQAGSARNGNYGLRVVQSAAGAGVACGNFSTTRMTVGMNVRVVSATGTVVVASPVTSSEVRAGSLLYDATNNKFGVRRADGTTVSWQSGTTALNTWVWVEWRVNSTGPTWFVDWTIETDTNTYTAQTGVSVAFGSTSTLVGVRLGHSAAQTATFDFDDVCITPMLAAYPLGAHKVPPVLVPETTGASVSGTSTNFNEFTANGTLAAFASTSGQRIDEVPPTISASSDGVVQVTLAASDYMNFPMTTYTCASDEVIAAVRALFSEWGGTGAGTGTIGFRGYDGTTETTFIAASASYDADSLTTASATYPLWKCAMWPSSSSTNVWSQTQLDNAALRVGFSTDATPDMGISAAYLEVVTRKAPTVRQITVEDPISATADIYVHPYTSASVSYVITNNDAARSVNFNYSISGTPQTPVTVGPSSSQTVTVNADSYGDVNVDGFEVI